jgi:glycosyltransferase involved in cell wall biosynthesis
MQARLGIAYKNFAAWRGISHVGLGIAAQANAEYLNAHGEHAVVFPVRHNIDIVNSINQYNSEHAEPLTHVVISAPWLSCRDMAALVEHFKMIQFAIVSHSNVGFLQADPSGIALLRDYIELSYKYDNLTVGGNSERFTKWLSEAYDTFTVLLPNMYPIPAFVPHKSLGDVIRIGSFGAIRPLKNQLTAAAAAIIIGERLEKPIEFHLSAGREEGGGNIVLSAIQQMVKDVLGFTLVLDGWSPWSDFNETVANMDLLIHPSYTESFNIVSADGISQGVPVVGSTAINWLPKDWQADSDDAVEIAERGIQLLGKGVHQGIEALTEHNHFGFKHWKKFLAS